MSGLRHHSQERLKSRKAIDRLFGPAGDFVKSYPLRLVYAKAEETRGPFPFQVTFVVPKRRFKRAVDRNRIKRLLREAYRLEKETIGAHAGGAAGRVGQYTMLFIYTGQEEMDFGYIRKKMRRVLEGLRERILN